MRVREVINLDFKTSKCDRIESTVFRSWAGDTVSPVKISFARMGKSHRNLTFLSTVPSTNLRSDSLVPLHSFTQPAECLPQHYVPTR